MASYVIRIILNYFTLKDYHACYLKLMVSKCKANASNQAALFFKLAFSHIE